MAEDATVRPRVAEGATVRARFKKRFQAAAVEFAEEAEEADDTEATELLWLNALRVRLRLGSILMVGSTAAACAKISERLPVGSGRLEPVAGPGPKTGACVV